MKNLDSTASQINLQSESVRLHNGDLLRFGDGIKMRVQIEEEVEEEEVEEGVMVEEWFEQSIHMLITGFY